MAAGHPSTASSSPSSSDTTRLLSNMLFKSAILILAASLQSVLAVVGPGPATGNISPVHDPTLGKNPQGTYILIGTGQGLPIRTSTDRTKWTLAGSVFPNGAPSDTDAYTLKQNGDLWAPDITWNAAKNEFQLYFTASSFGSKNSAIFQATSPTGLSGTWTYKGKVVSTNSNSNVNAIDANLLIDGSSWSLTYGSFFGGISQSRVNPATGALASTAAPIISFRPSGDHAEEAPFVTKQNGFYYLFTSWDKCCSGLSSTYNIRVSRSSSPTGPFTDKAGVAATNGGGTPVLASHDAIVGPGGQSIFNDSDGPLLVYHYYTSTSSNLAINKLDFSSGWPVVV